jgi:GTP cyclohydrolase I
MGITGLQSDDQGLKGILQKEGVVVATQQLLKCLDLHGPDFDGTPKRIARMWWKFIKPKGVDMTTFELKGKGGMIFIKNHECWSFCPHHLLPVRYVIKVGYLPENRQVLGLSKLARVCDSLMHKMPLQEDLAGMIARPIIKVLNPKGVGVIIEGEHLCMRMRGVESSCATAVSTFFWGEILTDESTRKEFMAL